MCDIRGFQQCLYPFSYSTSSLRRMPVKMIADRNRRVLYCDSLHLSLEVQRNSINMEVQLEIITIDISKAPPIPCDFGEVILSDVIQVNPMGILFKRPAILSIYHSIVELPELSSIGVKCYDFEIKEWIALPLHDGMIRIRTKSFYLYIFCGIRTSYLLIMNQRYTPLHYRCTSTHNAAFSHKIIDNCGILVVSFNFIM